MDGRVYKVLGICCFAFLMILFSPLPFPHEARASGDIFFPYSDKTKASEGVFESSQVCKQCHEDIYRNWRKSLHSYSYSNPIFLTAYRKAYTETKGEAKKYCLNCHAPTVRVTGDYDLELEITKEGVTCDFCHTVSEVNLDNRENPFVSNPGDVKRSVLKNAESEHHKTEFSEDFASSKLCAGCHDFVNRHGVHVGGTYSEWKESSFAKQGRQCQSCHMQQIPGKTAVEGGRDMIHDHSLSHNLSSMLEAVTVDIAKIQRTANRLGVDLVVTNARAGHSIPTGTPERSLVLTVQSHDDSGRILESLKKEYRKTVVDVNGAKIYSDGDVFLYGVKITGDNRLKSKEARKEKFVFSKRVSKIKSVSAEINFFYNPIVTERAAMRIPIYRTDSIVK